MTENKMPDEIWVDGIPEYFIPILGKYSVSEFDNGCEKYHHDRIVQELKLREAKLVEALEDMLLCIYGMEMACV
jgi:hypothetical protein